MRTACSRQAAVTETSVLQSRLRTSPVIVLCSKPCYRMLMETVRSTGAQKEQAHPWA